MRLPLCLLLVVAATLACTERKEPPAEAAPAKGAELSEKPGRVLFRCDSGKPEMFTVELRGTNELLGHGGDRTLQGEVVAAALEEESPTVSAYRIRLRKGTASSSQTGGRKVTVDEVVVYTSATEVHTPPYPYLQIRFRGEPREALDARDPPKGCTVEAPDFFAR